MSSFKPNKEHVLLFLFNQNKNASESRRILVETYGDNVLTQDACVRWFRRFKSGDFDLKDKDRPGQPKKIEYAELQALLDKDDTQTQQQMAEKLNVGRQTISDRLHAIGKIQKAGKWIPHHLNDRQMEKRKTVCEVLLSRHERKSFLHRIVTGNEK